MNRFIQKLAISVLCVFALGACAAQTSYITSLGPKARQSATGKCLMGANVLLSADDFSSDTSFRGVSIGNGYVISDAQAVHARDDLAVAFEVQGKAGLPRARAKVVMLDRGADIALLKTDGEPACDAVLADMHGVAASQEVHVPIMDGLDRGTIIEPHQDSTDLGSLNAIMRLSWSMHDASQGSGIYAEDGTMVGMRVRDTVNPNNVVALPADRIARFLRTQHVSYMQYDAKIQENGVFLDEVQ